MNILLIIIALIFISGSIWLVDAVFWAKKRKLSYVQKGEKEKTPLVIDYAKSLFPIFIIVLLIRSFVFQPFTIPTSSLEPTIVPGDYVFVTQYNYGLHVPVWHWTLFSTGKPKTGDIAVFPWPVNPQMDLIKRVIGVPGDKISYINKVLYINGKKQPQTFVRDAVETTASGQAYQVKMMQEDLKGVKHDIYVQPFSKAKNFYNLVVPKGKYFVMGDNRDNSEDSRFWGFVPLVNFEGKARFVFFSWDALLHKIRWSQIGKAL